MEETVSVLNKDLDRFQIGPSKDRKTPVRDPDGQRKAKLIDNQKVESLGTLEGFLTEIQILLRCSDISNNSEHG